MEKELKEIDEKIEVLASEIGALKARRLEVMSNRPRPNILGCYLKQKVGSLITYIRVDSLCKHHPVGLFSAVGPSITVNILRKSYELDSDAEFLVDTYEIISEEEYKVVLQNAISKF